LITIISSIVVDYPYYQLLIIHTCVLYVYKCAIYYVKEKHGQ